MGSCNGGCNRNPCACNEVPLPYYEETCFQVNQTQGCKIYHSYSPVLRILTAWAVPLADQILTLKVSALSDVMIGSLISNPLYGDYEIVSYEEGTQTIKVTKTFYNDKVVGTAIPSCTKFIVIANIYSTIVGYLKGFIPGLNYEQVTAAGSDETDAALVSGNVVSVVGADNVKGVILKNYALGSTVYIYNNNATDDLILYPNSGAFFSQSGSVTPVNDPITMPPYYMLGIIKFSNNEYVAITS